MFYILMKKNWKIFWRY